MYTDDLTLSLLSDDSVLANITYEQHKIKTVKNQFFLSKIFNLILNEKLAFPHEILNEPIFSFNNRKFPVFEYPIKSLIITDEPIVIVGREKFEREEKQRRQKNYMTAYNEGVIYTEEEDLISKYRKILKEIQFKNSINIFFIDTFKDLEILCKTIFHKKEKIFYLKTKSFSDEKEHLKNLLVKINGLTENFAEEISEIFKNLGNFLERGKLFDFSSIKIKNRRLTDNTIENINKLFFK